LKGCHDGNPKRFGASKVVDEHVSVRKWQTMSSRLHHEHLGSAETFRPYAMPDETWVREMAGRLKQR
jgi:hypothetical protein